jgi:hypothetical protein
MIDILIAWTYHNSAHTTMIIAKDQQSQQWFTNWRFKTEQHLKQASKQISNKATAIINDSLFFDEYVFFFLIEFFMRVCFALL